LCIQEDTGIRKDVPHPTLGDIKKLIAANHQAEFVSHGIIFLFFSAGINSFFNLLGWIEFHKSVDDSGDDGDKFIFAWGPRARVTVDRMVISVFSYRASKQTTLVMSFVIN
jgi:hypothetical protein